MKQDKHSSRPTISRTQKTRQCIGAVVATARDIRFWRRHLFIILLSAVFLLSMFAMAYTWYRYQLNPDAMSYMSIAQKYAAGDFRHALNGYWGPMLSWLLVPAVWADVNLIVAAKAISAMAGTAILLVMYSFLVRKGVSRLVVSFVCLAAALLLSVWVTVESITPDILIALWLVLLVVLLDRFMTQPSRWLAVVLGVLGATMYFTKGFGLFFFAAVVGLLALWQWWRMGWGTTSLQAIIKRYVPLAIVFAALVLPFIVANSYKYRALTINNAGMYNHHIFGPVAKDAQPIEYAGPLVPPNETATSAWEDPTPLGKMVPDWDILGSKHNLKFFVESVIGRNINRTLNAVGSFGPLLAFAIVTIVLGCMQRSGYRREFALIGLAGIVMAVGYLPVLTQARYLWGIAFLALMSMALWITAVRNKTLFTTLQLAVAGTLICSVMLLTASQNIMHYRYIDQQYHSVAMNIQPLLTKDSKIISDSYNLSYYNCFYMDIQCFSVVAPPASDTDGYYERLKSLGITHYIDYHTRDQDVALQAFVQHYFTYVDSRVVDNVPFTVYRVQ